LLATANSSLNARRTREGVGLHCRTYLFCVKVLMRIVRIGLPQKFAWEMQNALDDGVCQEETLSQ